MSVTYKKRISDNEVFKFQDGESPVVLSDFVDAVQIEIDAFDLNDLKNRYMRTRKQYLHSTIYHHHKVFDGVDQAITDTTVSTKRGQAHTDIAAIEAVTDITSFNALSLNEEF